LEKKKLYIQTFGCQMNVEDAQKMAALLKPSGYEMTDDPEGAQLILVNTCSIREKAVQKIYSQLGRFRGLKRDHPQLLIGVGGCLAQQAGEEVFKRAPTWIWFSERTRSTGSPRWSPIWNGPGGGSR